MASELEETTDLEVMVEETYQAELAAWENRPVNWETFVHVAGPYSGAVFWDLILFWLPLFMLVCSALTRVGLQTNVTLLPLFISALGVGAGLGLWWIAVKERKRRYDGIGPFGRWAYRKYLKENAIPRPVRLDPWSTEAIRKAVAYTQRNIRTEQEATLGRVWEAKLESGNALHAACEMRDRLADTASGTLLQSARLDALDRLIARHEVLLRDLDEQERIANEAPRPVLTLLETLEAELAQRDALDVLLKGEEGARLLEAETAAIRESVAGLVGMVRQCEASLNGLARDLQSRDSAEEELRQTMESA